VVESTEEAWPFVVTRNRVLDWRPIIAPEFMVEQGGYYLLTPESATEEDQPSTAPRERVISTERFGDLTLIYTTAPATQRLLGEASDQVLTDKGSRRISITAGLVLRGRHWGAAARWQHRLSDVTQMAAETFPKFWATDDEKTEVIASQPVASRTAVTPAASVQSKAVPVTSTGRRRALILIGAITFAFIIVYVMTRKRH
jgi:hypothetical protein